MTPWLLDLFCCAGGAAVGYRRAGFDVIGVDISPQPRYPFPLVLGDAIEQGRQLIRTGRFAAVHASPPCQAHSDLQKQSKLAYADFIPATRELLRESGLPYIIENVEGAPLLDPVTLCGAMFPELRVYRHRLFESNVHLAVPAHPRHVAKTFTHDKRKAHYGQPMTDAMFVQVTGGGNALVADKLRAMGIDWMTGSEANQAIPPAYTEFLGHQLLAAVELRREAAA
jgi:DNA (cytosine-5)-methyltransferase 1